MGLCISTLYLPNPNLNTTDGTALVVETDFSLVALEFSKFVLPEKFLQEKDWEDKTTKPYFESSSIWSDSATKSHRKSQVRCRDPTLRLTQTTKNSEETKC